MARLRLLTMVTNERVNSCCWNSPPGIECSEPSARSASPLSSACSICWIGICRVRSVHPGAWARRRSIRRGRKISSPMSVRQRLNTRRLVAAMKPSRTSSSPRTAPITASTGACSASARGVGCMPLPVFRNSWSPKNRRKRFRAWLTALCDMPRSCAARLTLRTRIRASKTGSRLRSILRYECRS